MLVSPRWFVFLAFSVVIWGQRPSAGVKVGVPVYDVCATAGGLRYGSANACVARYVVGPSFEVGTGRRFSVEIDALFTRGRLQGSARPVSVYPFFSTDRTGTIVEIPLLGKYRLLRHPAAPFAGVGPTFRRVALSGKNTIVGISGPPSPGQEVTSVSDVEDKRWQAGLVVGGGIEFRAGWVRFSPEVRYSRWPTASGCKDCGPLNLAVAPPSSTVLMLGVRF